MKTVFSNPSALRLGPRKLLAAVALPIMGLVIASVSPAIGVLVTCAVLAGALSFLGFLVAELQRTVRMLQQQERAPSGHGQGSATGIGKPASIHRLESRLWNGWSTTAMKELAELSTDRRATVRERGQAFLAMAPLRLSEAPSFDSQTARA